MSSHLVERAEDDSYTAVSQHVGSLLNQGEVCERLPPPLRFSLLLVRMSWPKQSRSEWPVAFIETIGSGW